MAAAMSASDPNSYSEPEKCKVVSLDWDVSIDFDAHIIRGFAHLKIERRIPSDTLVLDVHKLKIEQVTLQESDEKLPFDISNPLNVPYGSKLTIQIATVKTDSFTVSIKYETSSTASALDWMRPEQTAGKRQPYLYSQCQAIHARSLLPCQDTPGVKFPYTAKVRAPKVMTVLMSANRLGTEPVVGDPDQLTTSFSLKVPIPSYLLAIAAGDLESRNLGPRSKVWSERELVDAAAYEFAETESMLRAAEDLMGPYVWGDYDLLVLPPSFPFGGMENPCITFVTPTLLAGDRSLADVIAHEISHSWTGNLVTNVTFEDFWLNEGHTVFLERKILSRLHGEPYNQVHANVGWQHLQDAVSSQIASGEEPYTKLVPDLRGVDPDDAFSAVPYEKGFALLNFLQTLLGGAAVFDVFLRAYIEHFKYQSISTQQWKDFLYSYFSSQADQDKLNSVDWDKWLFETGMPPYQPNYDLSLARPVLDLSARWAAQPDSNLDCFSPNDLENVSSLLIKEFLSSLSSVEPQISLAKVQKLEEVYHFNSVRNSEIRFVWLRLCLKVQWREAVPYVLNFVNEQGRMKFVRPLYRDMYAWVEVRHRAIDNFLAQRAVMHSTTVKLLEKDLHLTD
ncbi:leukotriene A-4 hydrolase isoform X2 [Aplysia californica]|uniref:Leukotriene A-4 hydrolase isoform X2 n=1 Tax=Aplysia californica TaxID=6500 RepID=A0ABM0K219_APLCA|nr:leukotriene A-4 hydrolase isoform X2 [Aplysia californica]